MGAVLSYYYTTHYSLLLKSYLKQAPVSTIVVVHLNVIGWDCLPSVLRYHQQWRHWADRPGRHHRGKGGGVTPE